jgi:hypothetical protein
VYYGKNRNWLTVLYLIKKLKYDVNGLDSKGTTVLHEAVRQKLLGTITWLTSLGASPTLEDKTDDSSLSIAIANHFEAIATHLAEINERRANKVKRGKRIDGKTGFPVVCEAKYTIGGVEKDVVAKILTALNEREMRVMAREAKILLEQVKH